MIDIKVIKKPKNEGSTSALRTGGTAYGGMAVKEDGLLKFSHIHISHPTQTYPDCRIAH